jgi:hypothetical protein
VRWVDLLDDPARLEVELAKVGTTPEALARDLLDVPELKDELKFLRTKRARLRRALEWFGDEGHPQPKERTRPLLLRTASGHAAYGSLTPDWSRLPPLAEEPVEVVGRVRRGGRASGSFVEIETFWAVWEMALTGMSARLIARTTDERADLEYVNRSKVAIIVRAVPRKRSAAQRALRGRKVPRGFSATAEGMRLPDPKRG